MQPVQPGDMFQLKGKDIYIVVRKSHPGEREGAISQPWELFDLQRPDVRMAWDEEHNLLDPDVYTRLA